MRSLVVLVIAATLFSSGCESAVQRRSESCEGCHRPDGDGIEEVHLRFALRCTDCHGGDGTNSTLAAHVPGGTRAELRLMGRADLEAMSPELLRFLAPTHPRVVRNSCGSASPQGGPGAGCHQAIIDTLSVAQHSTLTGLLTTQRFEKGLQVFRPPATAVVDTVNPAFVASTAPRFTYGTLNPIPAADLVTVTGPESYAAVVLNKSCARCHVGGLQNTIADDQHAREGSFRSVGCASCHLEYATDGRSLSADPTGDPTHIGRPLLHQLKRSPADSSCTSCHQQSAFIGATYRGWRPADTDERPEVLLNNEAALGRPPGFWVVDEDGGTPGDNTPPDIHFAAGLGCADCHGGTDAHGDSNIWPHQSLEVGIRCENCHGGLDTALEMVDGAFRTSKGSPISGLAQADTTFTFVDGAGQSHDVPQLTTVASDAHNPADHGNLTCNSCHATWKVDVLRLNQLLDVRERSFDPISGADTLGTVRETYSDVRLNQLFLGQHADGRIGPLYAENTILDVIVPCDIQTSSCTIDLRQPQPGRLAVDNFVGTTSEGRAGLSFRPTTPHTTQPEARPCRACHPSSDGSNMNEVRAVYGAGVGRPTMVDSRGRTLDLTQFVDGTGTPTVAFGQLLVRPVEPEAVQRALAVTVE